MKYTYVGVELKHGPENTLIFSKLIGVFSDPETCQLSILTDIFNCHKGEKICCIKEEDEFGVIELSETVYRIYPQAVDPIN